MKHKNADAIKATMLSVDRLRELRSFFAATPDEKIHMNGWASNYNPKGKNEEYSCLTAGCLAGWAGVYKPFAKEGFKLRPYEDYISAWMPSYKAKGSKEIQWGGPGFQIFFGLTEAESDNLIYPSHYHIYDRCVEKKDVLKQLDKTIKKQLKKAEKLGS